ncbi:nucleotidyltransferase family protein [Anoxybacteroides tepidamans]|uniref:nucleotidyltransferase family protein n=1 Tax=Anoxybacteroides tepidamans TaxID=265948 RepID=UPI0009FBE5FF|nr:nucleotidyltransferase family protein [Anoxybacillus tepidamans]
MLEILRTVQSLHLPDWWVCAGFVRAKIWDVLHGFPKRTPLPDIDVIYFDRIHTEEEKEKKWERQLRNLIPGLPWSVKNQARMHIVNGSAPYFSSIDAMAKFPETATALGVALNENGDVVLAAPWGVDDAINMRIRPTPHFRASEKLMQIYEERLCKKNWQNTWPNVTVWTVVEH